MESRMNLTSSIKTSSRASQKGGSHPRRLVDKRVPSISKRTKWVGFIFGKPSLFQGLTIGKNDHAGIPKLAHFLQLEFLEFFHSRGRETVGPGFPLDGNPLPGGDQGGRFQ